MPKIVLQNVNCTCLVNCWFCDGLQLFETSANQGPGLLIWLYAKHTMLGEGCDLVNSNQRSDSSTGMLLELTSMHLAFRPYSITHPTW